MSEIRSKRSNSIQVIEYPPLDSKYSKFLEAIPLSDRRYKSILKDMESKSEKLSILLNKYVINSEKERLIIEKALNQYKIGRAHV